MNILYEDNHIIVVNKQAGQIVQGDKTGDAPLSELLKEYIKVRDSKPGNVFLGVPHRLDRPTSGIVVFTKTSKALSRFNQLFQEKQMQKTYWAIVKSKPEKPSSTLTHYLVKNEKKNKSFIVTEMDKKGKEAKLEYQLIASSDYYHLLEVKPFTGRHHQIRVQLSEIGCPIKGDLKYGFPRSNKDASICLHARKLNFIHPVKNEAVEIIAPPPKDPLWAYFLQKS